MRSVGENSELRSRVEHAVQTANDEKPDADRELLSAELCTLLSRIELHEQIGTETAQDAEGPDDPFARRLRDRLQSAQVDLGDALTFFEEGLTNASWTLLRAARRELLHVESRQQLEAHRRRLGEEADSKLSGWRRQAVSTLLQGSERATDSRDEPEDGSAYQFDGAALAGIVEAQRILDQEKSHGRRNLEVLKRRATGGAVSLAVVVILACGALAIAAVVGFPQMNSTTALLFDPSSLLVVVTLGALGACLSGLLSLRKRDLSLRITELRSSWLLDAWRPVVGAASAIGVVTILQSGVAGLSVQVGAALVGAFASGFSERFVSRAVDAAARSVMK